MGSLSLIAGGVVIVTCTYIRPLILRFRGWADTCNVCRFCVEGREEGWLLFEWAYKVACGGEYVGFPRG